MIHKRFLLISAAVLGVGISSNVYGGAAARMAPISPTPLQVIAPQPQGPRQYPLMTPFNIMPRPTTQQNQMVVPMPTFMNQTPMEMGQQALIAGQGMGNRFMNKISSKITQMKVNRQQKQEMNRQKKINQSEQKIGNLMMQLNQASASGDFSKAQKIQNHLIKAQGNYEKLITPKNGGPQQPMMMQPGMMYQR